MTMMVPGGNLRLSSGRGGTLSVSGGGSAASAASGIVRPNRIARRRNMAPAIVADATGKRGTVLPSYSGRTRCAVANGRIVADGRAIRRGFIDGEPISTQYEAKASHGACPRGLRWNENHGDK